LQQGENGMNLLDLALLFSLIIALYNLQQIKITLKQKGYPVEMLTGWLKDYRLFKELIQKEPEEKTKLAYQKIINGLHFSLAGFVVLVVMAVRHRM
jgi:hypothetical protein